MTYHCETKEDLDQRITAKGIVLVDFYAQWCGPCRAIAPKLEDMAKLYEEEGLSILKVDIDQVTAAVADYSVQMMPTFVFFKEGTEVARVVGADLNKLRRTLLDILTGKQ